MVINIVILCVNTGRVRVGTYHSCSHLKKSCITCMCIVSGQSKNFISKLK